MSISLRIPVFHLSFFKICECVRVHLCMWVCVHVCECVYTVYRDASHTYVCTGRLEVNVLCLTYLTMLSIAYNLRECLSLNVSLVIGQ